jgi:hypothetical protein
VGELPQDSAEWAKRTAVTARRLGVPGFAGDASLSANHEPLTGDTSYVISSLAAEVLFSLTARIDLTGLTRPLGDLASGLPAVGEGGNGSMRARIPASPEFRRTGVRGAYAAFTDLSLARRATRGWDMGPFRAGAILGTPGTASPAARSRPGAELNPAFLGKIGVRAMDPGSFTLSLRPVSPVTLREILSAPRSDLTPYRKLLSLCLRTGSDRETPLLQQPVPGGLSLQHGGRPPGGPAWLRLSRPARQARERTLQAGASAPRLNPLLSRLPQAA